MTNRCTVAHMLNDFSICLVSQFWVLSLIQLKMLQGLRSAVAQRGWVDLNREVESRADCGGLQGWRLVGSCSYRSVKSNLSIRSKYSFHPWCFLYSSVLHSSSFLFRYQLLVFLFLRAGVICRPDWRVHTVSPTLFKHCPVSPPSR